MTKQLPHGLAALIATAFALQGCASKPAAAVEPPAADFPVKPEEAKSDAVVKRASGWSATQVTASTRYVRIQGALPEAKGGLSFLADETGLRAGTVTLTQAEANAALVELTRLTKREPQSTATVTVATGNTARIKVMGPQKAKDPEALRSTISIKGMPFWERGDLSVELAISSRESAGEILQMHVAMQTTFFDGFIEYGDKLVTVLPGGEGGNPPPTTVKIPKGFYQPIFSTQSVKAEVQMASGAVIVLCADRAKRDASEGLVNGSGQAIKSIPPETMLVFLTAAVSPTKRAN